MLKLLDHPIVAPIPPCVVAEDGSRHHVSESESALPSFDVVYRNYWRLVWRSLGRLGAPAAAMDDLFQEVFLVVHRRLPEYEPPPENRESAERVWIIQIVRFVLRSHRRHQQRKGLAFRSEPTDLEAVASATETPLGIAERTERVRLLYELLDALDDDKREVFVLVELEGLSVRDAAHALNKNEFTTRSCLNAARAEFKRAFERHRARDEWRLR